MTYGQAYLSGWKETFNFSGRASRQQFWTFFLINVLIATAPLAAWCLATSVNPQYGILSFVGIPFAALWLLLMALPLLAVGCRRMHDIGRSGIWFVLGVIIPWFAIISLALCCLRSEPAPSRYDNRSSPAPWRAYASLPPTAATGRRSSC